MNIDGNMPNDWLFTFMNIRYEKSIKILDIIKSIFAVLSDFFILKFPIKNPPFLLYISIIYYTFFYYKLFIYFYLFIFTFLSFTSLSIITDFLVKYPDLNPDAAKNAK